MKSPQGGLLKVALLQLCAGANKAANVAVAVSMSQEAIVGGARCVLLPEVFNFRGDTRPKGILAEASESIPGPTINAFLPLAKKHRVSFLLGSILEKTTSQHVYNTSVFIDSSGTIAAKYRKINLFDACIGDKIIRESDTFKAGRRPTTAVVGEFRMGLSICYDLRFPALYQQYARRGVEILAIPSCFTKKTGQDHWETLLRARAIETLSYVLAPNQIGIDARGMQAYGHSMIVAPWGEVIARGSHDAQEIIFGEVNIEEVRKARRVLPGIIV